MRTVAVIGIWSVLLLCIKVVHATSIEVCATCTEQTLQAAIDRALSGDTIVVRPGTYRASHIVVDKPLYILGIEQPILEAGDNEGIMTVTADNVIIEGLTFQNVPTSYIADHAALRFKKVKDFVARNNRVNNTFFGIYVEHCKDGKIYDNIIAGDAKKEMSSGNAIHLWYSDHIVVARNTISKHRDGIYLEFVNNSSITHNYSAHNLRYGLHYMFSNDNTYAYNTFRDNGAGVAVMFSKRITMEHNRFEYNWGVAAYGLLLKEIYDAEIQYNTFTENCIGIYVEGSTRINYLQNTFAQNGWAIKISGGCLDNVITQNNFLSNTFDISLSSGTNNNTLDGNFWSAYRGYDLDKDGVGDIAYRPIKLFNYVANRTPETIVLLRSLLVDLINISEQVNPLYTPRNVVDNTPRMYRISHDDNDQTALQSLR